MKKQVWLTVTAFDVSAREVRGRVNDVSMVEIGMQMSAMVTRSEDGKTLSFVTAGPLYDALLALVDALPRCEEPDGTGGCCERHATHWARDRNNNNDWELFCREHAREVDPIANVRVTKALPDALRAALALLGEP